jgi:pimeloyl-ACP methyl ester carboxylesterase
MAYAEWGVPEGLPVLAFHGMPGSRLWCPDHFAPGMTTTERGVRLITFDRPGYGRSDPRPGHSVIDSAGDVEQLLDALAIDRCPLVGVSAGAPYAMASAARLPDRVTRLGSVSGAAPIYRVQGLWESRPDAWRAILEVAAEDRFAAIDAARERCEWLVSRPESVGDPNSWPAIDAWLAEDPAMREAMLTFVREAGRQGVDGNAWDLLALSLPWGFELREIEVATWLWQGADDPMVDRAEFDLLRREIRGSRSTVYPGEGHLLRGHWGDIFEALLG